MTAELGETVTAALAAATPGPWSWEACETYDNGTLTGIVCSPDTTVADAVEDDEVEGDPLRILVSGADAHLIANSPTWLAALVAENEKLRAEVEWYREVASQHPYPC